MEKCIKSVLIGGEDVEVIIVDDGSTKDDTAEIADRYAKMYPTIVKAVHQENGGHGQAVNTGLAHATGKFFKVVDSDDWVDARSYKKILTTLKSFVEGEEPDMVIANYVYDKVGAKRKKVIHYDNVFPVEQMFGWDDIGKFKIDQYILMHSVIYRTQLLKDCALQLPKHTFYVDNIFVFEPLPYVKKMYYITSRHAHRLTRSSLSPNQIPVCLSDLRLTHIGKDGNTAKALKRYGCNTRFIRLVKKSLKQHYKETHLIDRSTDDSIF